MKKICLFVLSFILLAGGATTLCNPNIENAVWAEEANQPLMTIIIDDFGGFDQSGVKEMLEIDTPLTCAVMPNLDNSEINTKQILSANKEPILHMPMQAHVTLPLSWYGTNYICTGDSKETIKTKIDKALESVPGAKALNIHIGSGVCQNVKTLDGIYDYVKENNLVFVDSRTHMNTQCEKVAKAKNVLYLGRDEFLEPDGNRTFEGVYRHILVGAQMAKDKGYSIIIGHVGSHGGINTAKAIEKAVEDLKKMGIKIVPLSELAQILSQKEN